MTVGFTDVEVAPGVVRTQTWSINAWGRRVARPGVRAVTHGVDGGTANGPSSLPTVSGDGHHVAFVSAASNLVADDANGAQLDVFSWDRASDTFRRLAVGAPVWSPRPSADGRYVALSTAQQLVAADTDLLADAFVWDTATGAVQLASPSAAAAVTGVSMSADGATVWTREAETVTAFDRLTESTAVVPPPAGTTWAAGYYGAAWVASGDGRFVVTSDTGFAIHDRTTATSGARCMGGQWTWAHAVSDDGRVLAGLDYYHGGRDSFSYPVVCRTDGTRFTIGADVDDLSADGSVWLDHWTVRAAPHTSDSFTTPFGADWTWRPKWMGTPDSEKVLPAQPPSSLSSDGATAVFTTVASNVVDTDPVLWGQPDIYLWDRTVSP